MTKSGALLRKHPEMPSVSGKVAASRTLSLLTRGTLVPSV